MLHSYARCILCKKSMVVTPQCLCVIISCDVCTGTDKLFPVGHTHEDVDQLCQKLERRLGKLGANHYQVGSVTTNVIDHPHLS